MNWPTYLDDAGIMAKSPEKGGQTLAQHTWQVLERLGDQYLLHPHTDARLWHWLYWGGLLHDFGKAADGFQRMLASASDNDWVANQHRHEVLSLAFADWLFPKKHPDRPWILAVIAFHHKDMKYITDKYGGHIPLKQMGEWESETIKQQISFLAQQITGEVRALLWQWLHDCGNAWARELKLPAKPAELISRAEAVQTSLRKAVFQALLDLNRWRDGLSVEDRLQAILCRGLIVCADHAASADAGTFAPLMLNHDIALRPLGENARGKLRAHQKAAADIDAGSAILIAPTGSGKTEAALLWAANQHRQRSAGRLFYTLPYQASMNAMARRLAERFYNVDLSGDENRTVTIQHSRAVLQFYQDYMNADSGGNAKAAARLARARMNQTRLNLYPVKVFSPYQMLKAAYSLKGYETLLADYTNALFVFDEIHAYDPRRLALIIKMIEWLRVHFDARFFVMTATLPPTVYTALSRAMFGADTTTTERVIRATSETFADSRRHTVVRREGDVANCIEEIAARYHQQGESVLVCCNTVARAQAIYNQLQAHIPAADIKMLHGRFAGRDRSAKESWLLDRISTGKASHQRQPTVFIATQVVEVSLDVDFDVLYTDPAPLEALLQRFGRVNRGRGPSAPLREVHVFAEPFGEDDSKPYDHRYVGRALDVLEAGPVDEATIETLLAQTYTGELADEWWTEYNTAAGSFQAIILDKIRPFESATPDVRDKFYELFDGRQILPAYYQQAYETALETGGYLAASEYLVNISQGQFYMSNPQPYDDYTSLTHAPYDPETGLDLAALTGEKDADL